MGILGDVVTESDVSVNQGGSAAGDLSGTYPNPNVVGLTNITSNLTFNQTTAVTIKQADKTTAGGTAVDLSIIAQSETGSGTVTAGNLILSGGTSATDTGHSGNIQLKAGATLLGTFRTDPSNGPYTEFVLGASQSIFLFQANAANQLLVFQTVGSGGGIFFDATTITFRGANSATALTITPNSAGVNTFDVASGASLNIRYNTTTRMTIDTTGIGFYGHATTAQQTGVAVTVAAIHAALVNLGLITA